MVAMVAVGAASPSWEETFQPHSLAIRRVMVPPEWGESQVAF